ncbi:MAG: MFS transporter [Dongiaceae bacterium]
MLVIGLGFLALALAFSARVATSLMMPIWEAELGWSRSFVSGSIAVVLIVMAILAPLGGRLVDLRGSRNVLFVGLLALAVGCLVIAATDSWVVYLLAFCGISAIGYGLVASHVVSTAVEQQLDRNQGFANGVVNSGATAGPLLLLPLFAVMLAAVSWRWTYGALALACLLLAVAIHRYMPGKRDPGANQIVASGSLTALVLDLKQILRKPAFHLLFWSYFICGYTTSGVIETHFLPYASFCGFTPVPSATAYGLLSATNLVGMIFVGWLTDRVNRPLLLGAIYILRGLTFILLVNVGADYETLLLFSFLFGLVDFSTVPVTASLVASHVGLRYMGLAFGLISAGHQVGGALGAYLGGYLFDLYAQYAWVWWSSLWLAVLAGVMVLAIRGKAPTALGAA